MSLERPELDQDAWGAEGVTWVIHVMRCYSSGGAWVLGSAADGDL